LFLGADAEYAYRFRGNLMAACVADGYRVVVAATPLADFESARFGELGAVFEPWWVEKAGLDPLRDLRALRQLVGILRRHRPDVLFTHTIKPVIYGGVLGWALGLRRRVAMIPGLGHTFMPAETLRQRVAALFARYGYRFVFGRVDRVIFHNDDDIADLHALGVLPQTAPVARVYGSGVDMRHYREAPFPAGPPTFVMVARLLREKGVYEFVEAARQVRQALPHARFVLVGAADANPSAVPAEELARWEAEGVVEVRGRLADTRPAYAESHVFVLPSYREGTPRTNLEAMSTGRAVITTDVPGCRETVRHDETGLLVPARDAAALAAAMTALGRDLERARRMGAAGRAFCKERYALDLVTRHTVGLVLGKEDDTSAAAARTTRQPTPRQGVSGVHGARHEPPVHRAQISAADATPIRPEPMSATPTGHTTKPRTGG